MSKKVLITGGSSGIGLSLAKLMSKDGHTVTTVARNYDNQSPNEIEQLSLDLSKVDQLSEYLKGNEKLKTAFDILVLNAGYGRFGSLEQFSYEQIRHLVDTNLISNLFLIKYYLPLMKTNGGGDIVLIGSESAIQGGKAGAVYCATKFAIRGLAQSLRADCATANIRVILINPGPVASDFFEELDFMPQQGAEFIIEPEEVAKMIVAALDQPRNVVCDEINMQPIKRSFIKK